MFLPQGCCGMWCPLCLGCSVASALNENCCIINYVPGGLWATRAKVRFMYGIHVSIDSYFWLKFDIALLVVFNHLGRWVWLKQSLYIYQLDQSPLCFFIVLFVVKSYCTQHPTARHRKWLAVNRSTSLYTSISPINKYVNTGGLNLENPGIVFVVQAFMCLYVK